MIEKTRSSATTETSSSRLSATASFLGDSKLLVYVEDITKIKVGGNHKRYIVRGCSNVRSKTIPIAAPAEKKEERSVQDEYNIHLTQADDESEEDDLTGKALFGFKTPKRPKRTVNQRPEESSLGSESRGTHKPADTINPANGGETGHGTEGSSTTRPKRRQSRKIQATTPYRLASRMDPGADSDNSIDSEESEDSSADETEVVQNRTASHSMPAMTDEFFKAQTTKSVTSDHTLARLREDGILDQSSLSNILSTRPNQYKTGVKQLFREHQAMFRTWMLQLCCGFNLLLYGYGSKKRLIEEFRRSFCSSYHCVVINGFFPSLTLRNIFLAIAEECLGLTITQITNTVAVIRQIKDYLHKKDEALFIFVHNIDGPMMRNSTIQYALASIASSDNVHVIASVDHINAPLMWNQSTVTMYRWLWYDATTFEPYIEETSYENSLMTQQAGTLALRAMLNVFKSLTPNARNIFILMARYHMDNISNPAYIGIPFQMLYQKCREGFLVNSDQTLRTQLTEFRDHKLIRSRKGVEGAEHLFLPIDSGTLNDFMEQMENIDS